MFNIEIISISFINWIHIYIFEKINLLNILLKYIYWNKNEIIIFIYFHYHIVLIIIIYKYLGNYTYLIMQVLTNNSNII